MKCTFISIISIILLISNFSLVQTEWVAQPERREAIKQAFIHNYEIYEKYAFGYDLIHPIAMKGVDNNILAGMGGTIIDSMSTMIIMGLNESQYYQRALEHVRKTDFTQTRTGKPIGTVSLFELTIRYIGGLISAFQLNGEKESERFLITKAASLANVLAYAWSWDTRIPYNRVNINKLHPELEIDPRYPDACLAEIGTLTLEWTSLSQYTANSTFRFLVEESVNAILQSPPVFPGLWPQRIQHKTEKPFHDYITWGGGTDSFFEYLLKYPLMLGEDNHKHLKVYRQTMESTIKHLVKKTGVGNLTFLADWSEYAGHGPIYIHSHLACFSGGNIAMAGRVLKNDEWTRLGLELSESCARTYEMTHMGIGPIAWGWFDKDGFAKGWEKEGETTIARREFYQKNGIFITMNFWNHQPEVIESIFYSWRITGDEFWRELAWNAFKQMQKYCEFNQTGWTGIEDVNDSSSGIFDEMQSFLFAELFKYFYLIFDDPDRFSLDDYVFNTEAHPQRRRHNANFGKVQGLFPYKPIYQKPTGSDLPINSLSSSSEPATIPSTLSVNPFQFSISEWPMFSDCSSGKEHNSFMRKLSCRWYDFLLWPFAILLGYRLSLCIGRIMRRMELQSYKRRPEQPIHIT